MTNLTILSKDIRTLGSLFSLNDLHKASGGEDKNRPVRFMRLDNTKEFIQEIEHDKQRPDLVFASKQGGTNKGTWVCKELVYAYAMWISPTFMLKVIRAFDQLISTPQLQTTSINQNTTLIQNANRAAERAYQLEQERQRELQELNDMVAQLERSTRIARNKIEIAMQSNNKQNDNLAHIDTMHSMLRLQ
ncbi:KilA-N domain-containing protein [Vibrio sp. 10N.261.46.E11]|uniref:KilA-N domain-containing protein n=1 Tax=Vibrio sp. 10N.261.46.E11 TaxID=3229662 RepID=UPI00354EEEFB